VYSDEPDDCARSNGSLQASAGAFQQFDWSTR
jgi:hypothetical protein